MNGFLEQGEGVWWEVGTEGDVLGPVGIPGRSRRGAWLSGPSGDLRADGGGETREGLWEGEDLGPSSLLRDVGGEGTSYSENAWVHSES